MKRILSFTLFTIVFFLGTSSIYAAENDNIGTEKISNMFIDFVDDAFNDLENLDVINSIGQDITEEFVEKSKDYYFNGNYKAIQNMIVNQDLSISIIRNTPVASKDDKNSNSIESGIRGKNVSKRFYHIEWDSSSTFRKEWTTTLSGTVSYNASTYQITNVSGPRISYQANFGLAFSPSLENIYTNSSYSGTRATLYANYDMIAKVTSSIGDFPVGIALDFGRHTDSFDTSSLPR